MVGAVGISLSGMMAAERRLGVSANNISNLQSTSTLRDGLRSSEPFVPQQVRQIALENGGTRAVVSDQRPASVPVYDPDHVDAGLDGLVDVPNVSLEREVVGQISAEADYKYNAKALKVQTEVLDSLINILG